eukprot:766730-Hanusia_phi.AAC.3
MGPYASGLLDSQARVSLGRCRQDPVGLRRIFPCASRTDRLGQIWLNAEAVEEQAFSLQDRSSGSPATGENFDTLLDVARPQRARLCFDILSVTASVDPRCLTNFQTYGDNKSSSRLRKGLLAAEQSRKLDRTLLSNDCSPQPCFRGMPLSTVSVMPGTIDLGKVTKTCRGERLVLGGNPSG